MSSNQSTYHQITACATAHHYAQYDDPSEIPEKDGPFQLSNFERAETAHIGYECTCGKRFNLARTAAEHLNSVDTDEGSNGGDR